MATLPDAGPFILGWTAYVAATASPGPAVMTIIETAVSAGRRSGLALALGVLSGSMTWAILTTLGVSALVHAEPRALTLVELTGGSYLLWLAYGFLRKSMAAQAPSARAVDRTGSAGRLYLKGYALHLTNPKAIMSWITLTSIALPAGSGLGLTLTFVGGCLLLGFTIFTGFAVLFSVPAIHRAYMRYRRPFEGAAAVFFAFAGFLLIRSAL